MLKKLKLKRLLATIIALSMMVSLIMPSQAFANDYDYYQEQYDAIQEEQKEKAEENSENKREEVPETPKEQPASGELDKGVRALGDPAPYTTGTSVSVVFPGLEIGKTGTIKVNSSTMFGLEQGQTIEQSKAEYTLGIYRNGKLDTTLTEEVTVNTKFTSPTYQLHSYNFAYKPVAAGEYTFVLRVVSSINIKDKTMPFVAQPQVLGVGVNPIIIVKSDVSPLTFSTQPQAPVYGESFDLLIKGSVDPLSNLMVGGVNITTPTSEFVEGGWIYRGIKVPATVNPGIVGISVIANGIARTGEITMVTKQLIMNVETTKQSDGSIIIGGALTGTGVDFAATSLSGGTVQLSIQSSVARNTVAEDLTVNSDGTITPYIWKPGPGEYKIQATFTDTNGRYQADAYNISNYDVEKQSQGILNYKDLPSSVTLGEEIKFYVQGAKSEKDLELQADFGKGQIEVTSIQKKSNGTWTIQAKAIKAGNVQLLATAPADGTYNATSIKGGFSITPQEMQLKFVVSPIANSKADEKATLTATFEDINGKVFSDGNVIFEAWQHDGSKKWSKKVPVSNGKAEVNWLPVESGVYELIASYDSAGNYQSTNQGKIAHTVGKRAQKALTFSTIPANPTYGTPVDLVIQGEPGGGALTSIKIGENSLLLNNLVAEAGNRWVLPNVMLPGIIGTAKITVVRAADSQYTAKRSEGTITTIAPADVSLNLSVTKDAAGVPVIEGALSGADFTNFPVAVNSTVKLVIKNLATNNSETFTQVMNPEGTMAAHQWITSPGTYEITGTLTMPAATTYYKAADAVLTGYDVEKESQGALQFKFAPPTIVGSNFTFYVQGGKSEGQLELLVADESVLRIDGMSRKQNGTWEVRATALKAKPVKITAVQPADATFNESTVEEILTIMPREIELLMGVSPTPSSKADETVNFTATFQETGVAINPEGTVIFEVRKPGFETKTMKRTIANGKAECSWLPTESGDYTIVAYYDQETARDYKVVSSVSASHTVEKQVQSDLTFSTDPASPVYGTPFDLHIAGDANGGNKLTFILINGVPMDITKVAKNGVNGWILPSVILKDQVGTISVEATRSGTEQFAPKKSAGNIQVLPKKPSLNLATKKEADGSISISGYLTGADFKIYPVPGDSKVLLTIKNLQTSEVVVASQSVHANGDMVGYSWNAAPGTYEITGIFTTPADKPYYKETKTIISAYDVEKKDQKLTFDFPNRITAGETFTFYVDGAKSTGELTLQMDAAYLKEIKRERTGEKWAIKVRALKAGDVQVNATQAGDNTYNEAAVVETISIIKRSMLIALAVSPTPSSKAQEELTFTATFNDRNGRSVQPDGQVIFEVWKDGGAKITELTTDVFNGRAIVNYLPEKSGDYRIVAQYDNTSSEQYRVRRSASESHYVERYTQAPLTFTTNPVEPLYGDTFDLLIQGVAGGGDLSSVKINGVDRDLTNLSSNGENAWRLPIAGVKGKIGTIQIEATRKGDDQYKKATSTGSLIVAAKEVTLNIETTPMVDGKITISGNLTGANFGKFPVPDGSKVALTIKKISPNGDSITENLGVYTDGNMVDYTWEPMPGEYEITATFTAAKGLYIAEKVVVPTYDVAKKPQDALRFKITEPIIMGSEFTFQVMGGTNHSEEELQLELEEGSAYLTIQSVKKRTNSFVWDVKAKAEKAGNVRLLATLPGDEVYNDTFMRDYLTIHPREMDLILSVTSNTSKLNEQVTLSATFTDQGDVLVPTGHVIFEVHEKNGGMVYKETVAISNGQASLNWLAKEIGNYTIVARYDQEQSTDYKVRNQGEVDHRVLKQILGINRLTVTPNEGLIAKETLTITWEALALLKTNKMLPSGMVEFIAENTDTGAIYKKEVRFQTNPLDLESVLATWEIPNIKKGNYVISAQMLENNSFRASEMVYLNGGIAYEVQGAKQDPLLIITDKDTLTYGKEFNFQVSGGSGEGELSTFDVIRGPNILDLDVANAERHFGNAGIDWTMKALPRDVGEAEVSVTKAGDDYYDDITVTKRVTIGATELNLDVTVRPEMSTKESEAKKDVRLEGALTGFNPDVEFAPAGTIALSITSLDRLEESKTKEIPVRADGTIEPWDWKMLQTGFYEITGTYTDDTGHYVANIAEIKPYTVNGAEQEPLVISTKPDQVKNNKVKVGQTFDILITGGSGDGAVSKVEATVGAHLVEIGAIKKLPAKTRADAPTWQVSVTTYEAGDITIKAVKAEDAYHNPVEATVDLTITSRNGKLNLDVNPKDNILVGDNVTFSTKMEDVTDALTKPALSNNMVSPNGIGAIAFEVINQSTGKVMWYRIVEVTLSGETLCGWTPSEAGSYTVKAIYLTDKTKQYNAIPEETIHITVKAKAGEGTTGTNDGTGGSGTSGTGYSGSGSAGGSGGPKTGDYASTMTILALMTCAGAVLLVLNKKKEYRKK